MVKKLTWYFYFLLFFCIVLTLIRILPNLNYMFDIDPSDGDLINIVNRILALKPMYLDWARGDVSLIYAPIYFFLLSIAKFVGFNPVIFARWVNFGFWLGCLLMCLQIIKATQRKIFLLVPCLALLLASNQFDRYDSMINIRPDMMAVFLILLAIYLANSRRHAFWVAATCTLAIFSKQHSVGASLGLCIYYLIFDRKNILKFMLGGLVTATAIIIPMEVYNRGQFLNSIFLYPRRLFVGDVLSNNHAKDMFTAYHYFPFYGILLCAFAGLFIGYKRKSKYIFCIGTVFITDLLLFMDIGRNLGGGLSYLWLHWFLTIILMGVTLDEVFFRLKDKKFYSLTLTVLFLFSLIITSSFVQRVKPYYNNFLSLKEKYKTQNETMALHQQAVEYVIKLFPQENWYSERLPMILVNSGVLLDQEACTLGFAFTGKNGFDSKILFRRFLHGEYPLVQRWNTCIDIPGLIEIFNNCYLQLRSVETYERGNKVVVDLLHFDRTRPQCANIALKYEVTY